MRKIKRIKESFRDYLSKQEFSIFVCNPSTVQIYFFNEKGVLLSETSGKIGLGFNHLLTTEYNINDNISTLLNINKKENSKRIRIRSVDKKWMSNYCKTILSNNKKDLINPEIFNEYEYDNYNNWVKKIVFINGTKRFIYEREIIYYDNKNLKLNPSKELSPKTTQDDELIIERLSPDERKKMEQYGEKVLNKLISSQKLRKK